MGDAAASGRLRLAFDGGARGNPGPAAWGVAVLDDDGRFVEGWCGFLGTATNNVAEYTGLLEALRVAVDRGASEVAIASDSELIVKQIRGEYRVRNAQLRPLYEEAVRRMAAIPRCVLTHVRRANNKDADRLVNVALDAAEAGEPAERRHERAVPA